MYNLARSWKDHINHHVRGEGCWCRPIITPLIENETEVVGYRIVHQNYEFVDGSGRMLVETSTRS